MTVPDVLTIGRVSVDLYTEQAGVPLREATTFRKSIGGTSTNVAVAAARLGLHAATVTKVGDDALGDYVRHALAHTFGVDVRWVGVDPTLKTPLAFAVLDPASDPSVFFYREPRAPDQDLTLDDVDLDVVRDVPVLWIPGVVRRLGTEPVHHPRGARRPAAGAAHTVLDLDWRPMFWSSAAEATAQIAPLARPRDDRDRQPRRVRDRRRHHRPRRGSRPAARPRARGGDREARRRRRARGAWPTAPASASPRSRSTLVCGLGSGDAFGGALCHALVTGLDLAEGARRGNAAGAIVAGRMMCADDMPTPHDIDALLDSQRARRNRLMTRPTLGIGVVGFGWMGQAHSRSAARISSLFPERTFDTELVICGDNVPARQEQAIDGFGFREAAPAWRGRRSSTPTSTSSTSPRRT